jgi:hypothetical protein
MTRGASNRIRSYVQSDETLLRQKLVDRHNQIMNEYQWMSDCSSPENRELKEYMSVSSIQTKVHRKYSRETVLFTRKINLGLLQDWISDRSLGVERHNELYK